MAMFSAGEAEIPRYPASTARVQVLDFRHFRRIVLFVLYISCKSVLVIVSTSDWILDGDDSVWGEGRHH